MIFGAPAGTPHIVRRFFGPGQGAPDMSADLDLPGSTTRSVDETSGVGAAIGVHELATDAFEARLPRAVLRIIDERLRGRDRAPRVAPRIGGVLMPPATAAPAPEPSSQKAFLETEDGTRVSVPVQPGRAHDQPEQHVGRRTRCPAAGSRACATRGANSGVLRVDLFFDTTDTGTDVSTHTGKIVVAHGRRPEPAGHRRVQAQQRGRRT